jgi:CTP-dependent riboflavin kinase
MTAPKLTPAQQRTFNQILDAKPSTPDKVICGAWLQVADWTSVKTGHTWKGGRVYGSFNTSTLKALEKKGLIRVHGFGTVCTSDIIEVIAPARLADMLECRH